MPAATPQATSPQAPGTRDMHLVVDPVRFTTEMARRGLHTDDQIATLLGTNRTTINRLRRGKTVPSNRFLAICVDADVNPMKFLAVDYHPQAAAKGRAA